MVRALPKRWYTSSHDDELQPADEAPAPTAVPTGGFGFSATFGGGAAGGSGANAAPPATPASPLGTPLPAAKTGDDGASRLKP